MCLPELPGLPVITGDVVLETFSPKSLNLGYSHGIATSPDNQRPAELGRMMLELIVTQYLYSRKPIVAASEIPVRNKVDKRI